MPYRFYYPNTRLFRSPNFIGVINLDKSSSSTFGYSDMMLLIPLNLFNVNSIVVIISLAIDVANMVLVKKASACRHVNIYRRSKITFQTYILFKILMK